jgi:hypothetical protein
MRHLGLTDNPFDPRRLSGNEPQYLGGLNCGPLRVDLCDALEPLYFADFPIASRYVTDWKDELAARGYEPGEIRSNSSFVKVIRGPRGSGKTTLAARLLRYLKTCGTPADPAWKPIDLTFPDSDITLPQTTEHEIDQLCREFGGALDGVGRGNWVCSLVDNVTESSLGKVLAEFLKPRDFARVLVITSDQLKLLDGGDLHGYPVVLDNDYKLEAVEAEAAVAYAQSRVGYFRHKDYPDGTLCDQMFPLLPNAVRRWAAHDSNSGPAIGNPLVARVLNTMLTGKIDELFKLFRRSPIRDLPPPENVTLARLQQVLEEL